MTKSQYRCFFLAADDQSGDDNPLNVFLRSYRVQTVDRQFVAQPVPGWAFCVAYLGKAEQSAVTVAGKPRIDYREVLNAEDFAVFDNLRALRTEIAERESKQVYSVFTNAQLAAMVQANMHSVEQLRTIKDVGEARCANYGEQFLQRLQAARAVETP